MTSRLKTTIEPYVLISPVLFVMLLVLVYPFISTIILSFDSFGTKNTYEFTWKNYAFVLKDSSFWMSAFNTLVYLFFSVGFHFILGFAVALMLNYVRKSQNIFRTLMIIPWTIPPVVVAATWKWIYNPTSGLLNNILIYFGWISEPVLWLSSKYLAMSSIITANIWRGFPYVMLILLAGLQSIPRQLYESAEIDGAGGFQRFKFITFPALRKNIIVALALDTVLEARKIDLVHAMTGGGPGRLTDILVTTIYKNYFNFFQFEYSSAMAILTSIGLLLISIPYIRSVLRED